MNKKPKGEQLETVEFDIPFIQESFDLNRMDEFVKSLGTQFYHWKATPSPIGLNDKGDYRRNNGVDVMTSNGYLYNFGGIFTATLTGNQKMQPRANEGGLIDSSTAYLILPRHYDKLNSQGIPIDSSNTLNSNGICNDNANTSCTCDSNQQSGGCMVHNNKNPGFIRLTPGDRLYCDPTIDDLVINKELIQYSFGENVTMFPIVKLDAPIVDSRGISYQQNIDFTISCNGNILWIDGRPNPGFDPDTGQGRTYSVRYLYRCFYYVTKILREVRVTNVTENGVRTPKRMPMFVEITREYLYHNVNRGNETNQPPNAAIVLRQTISVPEKIDINQPIIRVETTDIDNDT